MENRRLVAILAADVVGSSRLIEADESHALATIRAAIHDDLIATALCHGGRTFKTMGDGALIEFSSVVAAVTCAYEVQKALSDRAATGLETKPVRLRIGINLGDVVSLPDGDLYGDGVNVAARLESLAAPGGIAISAKVYDELHGKLELAWRDRGEQALKNISRPVRVYSLGDDAATATQPISIAAEVAQTVPSLKLKVTRDVSVLDALYYVAFGSWQRKPWAEMGGLTGEITKAGQEIRQKARDSDLPMWGAHPGSQILNPIDADYWAYYGIDFMSVLKGSAQQLGTELKESGIAVNVGKLVWLMTSKVRVEELWPPTIHATTPQSRETPTDLITVLEAANQIYDQFRADPLIEGWEELYPNANILKLIGEHIIIGTRSVRMPLWGRRLPSRKIDPIPHPDALSMGLTDDGTALQKIVEQKIVWHPVFVRQSDLDLQVRRIAEIGQIEVS